MVRGGLYPQYRCGGRFYGRRVNCEHVPLLPAKIVGQMLDDPRQIPYLLIWRSRSDGTVQEAVRISAHIEPPVPFPPDWTGVVEVKRHDGTRYFIRTALRSLPRNGGRVRLWLCPYCQKPRRALYGWEPGGDYTSSARRCIWQCRSCAGLRYASEGDALVLHARGSWLQALEMQYGPSQFGAPPTVASLCVHLARTSSGSRILHVRGRSRVALN